RVVTRCCFLTGPDHRRAALGVTPLARKAQKLQIRLMRNYRSSFVTFTLVPLALAGLVPLKWGVMFWCGKGRLAFDAAIVAFVFLITTIPKQLTQFLRHERPVVWV